MLDYFKFLNSKISDYIKLSHSKILDQKSGVTTFQVLNGVSISSQIKIFALK